MSDTWAGTDLNEQRPRLLALVVWLSGVALTLAVGCGGDDDEPVVEDPPPGDIDDPAPGGGGGAELRTCPDYLEDFGPYREGIDPEYDPAMDWDSDGVSCE